MFKTSFQGRIKLPRESLALDLINVHEDPLSGLGGGKYFACVDMRTADGTVYEIDFFIAAQPGGRF